MAGELKSHKVCFVDQTNGLECPIGLVSSIGSMNLVQWLSICRHVLFLCKARYWPLSRSSSRWCSIPSWS